jgi:serine/threonine protein kinase
MDVIFQQLNSEAPLLKSKSNRQFPSDLEALVAKALQKDPEKRYQSMAQLRDQLNADILDEKPQDAASITERFKTIPKTVLWSVTVLLLLLILVPPLILFKSNQDLKNTQLQQRQEQLVELNSEKPYKDPNEIVRQTIRQNRNNQTMKLNDSCNDDALSEFTTGDFAATEVDLENADIKGPGLAYLIRLPLTKLDLKRSSITDRGLLEISKMSKLESLLLDATKLSGAGFPT